MGPLDVLLNTVAYDNRKRVKDDVKSLTDRTKVGALMPKIGSYVKEDGTELRLLMLGGTVPIFYSGAQYNIPVDIYIPQKYPYEPPIIYVRPTPNMTIKANHRHVDMQGKVYLPYLHEWNTNANLIHLVEVTSSVFSIDPPLFSKPATTTVTPPSSSATSSSTSALYTNPSYSAYPGTAAALAASAATANVSYGNTTASYGNTPIAAVATPSPLTSYNNNNSYPSSTATTVYPSNLSSNNNNNNSYLGIAAVGSPPMMTTTSSTTTAASTASSAVQQQQDRHRQLVQEVTQRLQDQMTFTLMKDRDELLQEFESERYLRRHEETEIMQTIQTLQADEKALQENICFLQEKVGKLKEFAIKQQEEQAKQANLPLEDFLENSDELSSQIVRVQSEILAINDCFYWLEKALLANANNDATAGGAGAAAGGASNSKKRGSTTNTGAANGSGEEEAVGADGASVAAASAATNPATTAPAAAVAPSGIDIRIFQAEIRKLARKQFLAKALLKKIEAKCSQEMAQLQQPYQQQQQTIAMQQYQTQPQQFAQQQRHSDPNLIGLVTATAAMSTTTTTSPSVQHSGLTSHTNSPLQVGYTLPTAGALLQQHQQLQHHQQQQLLQQAPLRYTAPPPLHQQSLLTQHQLLSQQPQAILSPYNFPAPPTHTPVITSSLPTAGQLQQQQQQGQQQQYMQQQQQQPALQPYGGGW